MLALCTSVQKICAILFSRCPLRMWMIQIVSADGFHIARTRTNKIIYIYIYIFYIYIHKYISYALVPRSWVRMRLIESEAMLFEKHPSTRLAFSFSTAIVTNLIIPNIAFVSYWKLNLLLYSLNMLTNTIHHAFRPMEFQIISTIIVSFHRT